MRSAWYNTFCTLWRKLTPQIMVMKPMTDLCWVCQQNSSAIMRAANTPEEEKSDVIIPLTKFVYNYLYLTSRWWNELKPT